MKKGDIIARKRVINIGDTLIHGVPSDYDCELVYELYPLNDRIAMDIEPDPHNPLKFRVIAKEPTFIQVEARVNWVVDFEAGISYLEGDGMKVINLQEEIDWFVIHEATPQYQSSVENMSDEQLRESIELLRARRSILPTTVQKPKRVSEKQAPVSAQEKALAGVLGSLSGDARVELMRKLGLVD